MTRFFVLLFALSLPFWIAGSVFRGPGLLPMDMPVSAFQFVLPLVVAMVCSRRDEGVRGVATLLRRLFSVPRRGQRAWWVPVVLLVPATMLLSYGLIALAGVPLDGPRESLATVPVLFAVYAVAAACEETGWMGYVLRPLQRRWGVLGGAVVLGVVWAVWHVVGYVQGGRAAWWIVGQCLSTVALRVLMVWLFHRTGQAVLPAVVIHALINVAESVFPGYPQRPVAALAFGLVTAAAATMVTLVWGARTSPGSYGKAHLRRRRPR
ncbi:CPBP family intramembrane glutamic endopeptidase [Streptomyces sp. NPDC090442]|uniref:CPBP family intramembrane glutamic endopeptidase n=1 Tax=Streptomyces sp. NPDC090442 TaxID=3365962 RepID=UPI003813AEFE